MNWARDNGKTIYYGPEEDFLQHKSRDPNCVEVPSDRPTVYHNWDGNDWVEDPEVKYTHQSYEAEQKLKETDRYMVIDSELSEAEIADMRAYRDELRKVIRKERDSMPTKPERR